MMSQIRLPDPEDDHSAPAFLCRWRALLGECDWRGLAAAARCQWHSHLQGALQLHRWDLLARPQQTKKEESAWLSCEGRHRSGLLLVPESPQGLMWCAGQDTVTTDAAQQQAMQQLLGGIFGLMGQNLTGILSNSSSSGSANITSSDNSLFG